MPVQKCCDFCDRTEDELPEPSTGSDKLVIDTDGLWVCQECRSKLTTQPTDQQTPAFLEDALLPLVGKSAGAICRTLALPYEPPYRNILDAASTIAYDEDRYMSTWTFVSQWLDGTTVWHSPDGASEAFVSTKGDLRIISR
jgi:hypothetical protein